LKYYYPLEWWCCVLQNAKKDEISEKFWKYCCHFVDMPDIRYSGENFEIHNDRIRAPLGFLTGVGEKAQIELARGRPYTNLEDFCRKIVDTKNTKTVDDTGKEKAGRSAVHSGIVTKLIVSGVMDSFFEPGSSINQKIDEYLEIFKKVSGKKPPKIDKAFCENLDQLKIFQIRKQILPIHSEPILQHVDLPNFTETSEGKYTYQLGKKSIPVLSGKRFKLIQDQVIDMHEAPAVVGIVGYVESDTTFNTKYGKAMKMVVDCDGHYSEFVQWARKDGVATEYPKYLTGSIVLLTLEQNYYKTSYSIGEVIRIRMPMDYKHEET
jgi:DNA polymerase III alpha subunit